MNDMNDMNNKETMKIGTIDIETLSLSMTPVITEIGMMVSTVHSSNGRADYSQCYDFGVGFYSKLDLLDQLRLGRDVSADTIAFQERTFGFEKYREMLYGIPGGEGEEFSYAFDALCELKNKCKDLDELWMNHPTFDSGRLHTLAQTLGIGQLWNYSIERDICTIKKSLDLTDIKTQHPQQLKLIEQTKHTALGDCFWNMAVLEKFGQFNNELEILRADQETLRNQKVKVRSTKKTGNLPHGH